MLIDSARRRANGTISICQNPPPRTLRLVTQFLDEKVPFSEMCDLAQSMEYMNANVSVKSKHARK